MGLCVQTEHYCAELVEPGSSAGSDMAGMCVTLDMVNTGSLYQPDHHSVTIKRFTF